LISNLPNYLLQAHLKTTLSDAQPKLLKELAKIDSLTHCLLPRQFSAPKPNNKALAITRTML
ncbi:MAG: hypothetical protein Q7J06_11545, partial [Bacteroidales bacterium]|nr:hypothetical protein [Bacteroidales bacterium]